MSTSDNALGLDPLETLGVLTGAFLVLVGVGTVAGTPWTTGGLAGVVQTLGGLGALAVGAALAWVVRE